MKPRFLIQTLSIVLLVAFTPLLAGCSSSKPVVVQTNALAEVALDHYRNNMATITGKYIDTEHDQGIAAADAAHEAAWKSHVKPDGTIDAGIAQALTIQRLKNYQVVEKTKADAVSKVAAASQDGANAARYLGALSDYWQQQATSDATTKQITDTLVASLDTLIAKFTNTKVVTPVAPTTKP